MNNPGVLFLLFLGLSFTSIAQTSYPEGCYMSLAELRAKSPTQMYALDIEERTTGEIRMNGGNDFKFTSPDKSVKKKVLKKQIWAISDGTNLYINCYLNKCQLWYAKVELEEENELVFNGGVSNGEAAGASVMGGAIGGAAIATKRYIYTLDLTTGQLSNGGNVKRQLGEDDK